MTNNNNLKMIFVAALFAQNGLISGKATRNFDEEIKNLNDLKSNVKAEDFGFRSIIAGSADVSYMLYDLSGISIFGGINGAIGRDAINKFSYGANLIATVVLPFSLIKKEGVLSKVYGVLSMYVGGMKNSIAVNISDYVNFGVMIGAGFNFTSCVGVELAGGYEKLQGGILRVSPVYTYDGKIRGRVNIETSLRSLKALTENGKAIVVGNAGKACEDAVNKVKEAKTNSETEKKSETAASEK